MASRYFADRTAPSMNLDATTTTENDSGMVCRGGSQLSKLLFNSTAIGADERPAANDDEHAWRDAADELRLSPILHSSQKVASARGHRFQGVSGRGLFCGSDRSVTTTSQSDLHNSETSSERESRVETTNECESRRLDLIEEDKENEVDVLGRLPGTSTPVRDKPLVEDTNTTRSYRASNPFESCMLESLSSTVFSPSFFISKSSSAVEKEETPPGPFRWSIDQLARLLPADIDESQSPLVDSPDPVVEARMNSAIEKFWNSQKYVVPSPGFDPSLTPSPASRQVQRYPLMTQSGGSESSSKGLGGMSAMKNMKKIEESPLVRPGLQRVGAMNGMQKRTVESQTLLTFPPSLDLVSLLGGRFVYDEADGAAEEAAFSANLSLNTLRRKLFSSDSDLSFISKSNGSELTEHESSPQLLPFTDIDEECAKTEWPPDELENGRISFNESMGDNHIDNTFHRQIASPNISPIKFE